MATKRFVLVAFDKSPSDAFTKLADALKAEGHEVIRFLGAGKLVASESEVRAAVLGASVVLTGMSSKPESSALEIAAVDEARMRGVQFGFFSDTFYCYRRGWFGTYRSSAAYLLISSAGEIPDAVSLFPNAKVSVVGNPSWELVENPRVSKEEMLRMLEGDKWERIVLIPFNKDHAGNLYFVEHVFNALKKDMGTLFVLAPHPGELNQDPEALAKYKAEVRQFETPWYKFAPDGLGSSDLVHIATIVISACSPTTDLQAVFLDIPVINFVGSEETIARLEKEFGSRTPPLVELGVVALAVTEDEIHHHYHGNVGEIVAGQRQAFMGAPRPGTFLARATELLDD